VGKCTKYNKTNIGKTFCFTLLKEIVLPDNPAVFYIISDNNNCKFTIPKNYYAHYEFDIGQKIECRLDKINCSGHLFFEPKNPHYNEKTIYNFKFVEFKDIKNNLGFNEQIAVVTDFYGKKQWIRNAQNIKPTGNYIKAVVAYIKKGRLFLLPESSYKKILTPHKTFDFKIVGKTKLERFGNTYILNDKFGNTHVLPMQYYQNFNLKNSVWFKGIVNKLSSKGFLYIEPLHPKYTIGRTYRFKVINTITDNNTNHVFVEDCHNNLIKTSSANFTVKTDEKVMCRVIGLKKGKPILSEILLQ